MTADSAHQPDALPKQSFRQGEARCPARFGGREAGADGRHRSDLRRCKGHRAAARRLQRRHRGDPPCATTSHCECRHRHCRKAAASCLAGSDGRLQARTEGRPDLANWGIHRGDRWPRRRRQGRDLTRNVRASRTAPPTRPEARPPAKSSAAPLIELARIERVFQLWRQRGPCAASASIWRSAPASTSR